VNFERTRPKPQASTRIRAAQLLLITQEMRSIPPQTIAILAALLFVTSACNRAPTTNVDSHGSTADDVRIGREAISLSEVSLLARTGLAKEALTAVKRRHVPEHLSAEEELQFRGFANAELLAALKDSNNILTPTQKDAYDEAKGRQAIQKEQVANRKNLEANNQLQKAYDAASAEQQEKERRAYLSQIAMRQSEQRVAEQTARERQQLRDIEARSRREDEQNRSRPHYVPYYPANRIISQPRTRN
jgi:flagellar biosynthesis GTPase FlhF